MAISNKQRLDLIETYIQEHKYADLHVLANEFNISLSTVRRALNDLEAGGLIRRHHGGASLIENDLNGGYDFITQDDTNAGEKHRIAEKMASIVQDGMSVMLDGGTTTYAVAKALLRKRLIVITNSLPIAALLNEISACETIVTGGTIYNRLGVLYGPICENNLSEMHADVVILGCAGITEEGFWNSNAMLASYQQKMLNAAKTAYFVVDSSKIGRRAISLTTRFRPNLNVVTTANDHAFLPSSLQENNGELILV